jgi:hypothetical protein
MSPLGRPRCEWEDNIKMGFYEYVNWTELLVFLWPYWNFWFSDSELLNHLNICSSRKNIE